LERASIVLWFDDGNFVEAAAHEAASKDRAGNELLRVGLARDSYAKT